MITRRGMLGFMLSAPAVIQTPGLLMPVKAFTWPLEPEPLPPGVYTGKMANFIIQARQCGKTEKLLLAMKFELEQDERVIWQSFKL